MRLLQLQLDDLAALQERTRELLDELSRQSNTLLGNLGPAGPALNELLRKRAAEISTSIMDAAWVTKPPVERDAALNRAVHAAALPVIDDNISALSDRVSSWVRSRLAELVSAEAEFERLCAEPGGVIDKKQRSRLVERVNGLFETLLPDYLNCAKLRADLERRNCIRSLLDFPRRLTAPASFPEMDGIPEAAEWAKEVGANCTAGERLVRLSKGDKVVWVSAPSNCSIAWIVPRGSGAAGASLAPNAVLGFLEPPLAQAENAATGGALVAFCNVPYRFHLEWAPDRPRVEQNVTKEFAATAIGAAGKLLRSANESLKSFDSLRRSLDAGTTYFDRQLRAMTLANLDAALRDEMSRLRLRDLPGEMAAEASGAVMAALPQRFAWIAAQAAQKSTQLRLQLEREAVLLERGIAEAKDLETQVLQIAQGARWESSPNGPLSAPLQHSAADGIGETQ
jgi:hypothetical protein